MKKLLLSLVILLLVPAASAEEVTLTVMGWNLESGDSSSNLLADQCAEKGVVDIWGFSEVQDESVLDTIEARVEDETGLDYEHVISTNAGGDKLGILFNTEKLKLEDSFEEKSTQLGSPFLRPVLVGKFRGKKTNQVFLFMVNHLKANSRRNNSANVQKRVDQSKLINDLAETTNLPVVCLGDFNYLFKIDVEDGDSKGFDELTKDGVFEWVKPAALFPTHNQANSNVIFDFVFVANRIPGWDGEAVILEREGNTPVTDRAFPTVLGGGTDNRGTTDHRPVRAIFRFDDESSEEAIEVLRSRIAVIKDLLRELEEQLESLESATGGQ